MRRSTSVFIFGALVIGACSGGTRKPAVQASSRPTSSTSVPLPEDVVVAGSVWPGKGAFAGPQRLVHAGGITVGYRRFGSGPDLVLLEGEEMTMSQWPLSLLRDLAAHWRVTIFDWRGVDRTTDNPKVSYTISQLADDTAALFDAIGLRRPFVYGLSTGGEVGLALMLRHPDRVAKLVVSGATPGGADTVPTVSAIDRQFNDPTTSPMTLLGFLFPPGDTKDRDAYLAELLQVPQTLPSSATTARQQAAELRFAAGPGLASSLRAARVPVLVLNGVQDQLVPAENARRIAALIPGARLELFEDAGHLLIFQDRARFLRLLKEFFQ